MLHWVCVVGFFLSRPVPRDTSEAVAVSLLVVCPVHFVGLLGDQMRWQIWDCDSSGLMDYR